MATENLPGEGLFPEDAICTNCSLEEDAVAYCLQCKRLLCEDCQTYHKRQVDTQAHPTVDSPRAGAVRSLYRCPVHGDKTLDYFCKTCDKAVCQHCQVSTSCKDHSLEVSTNVREEMGRTLSRAKDNRDRFSNHAEFINAITGQNKQALIQCEGGITQAFDDLIQELGHRRDTILAQLRSETERNDQNLERQREFVKSEMEGMNRTIGRAENLLGTKKDAKLMVNKVRSNAELERNASQAWDMQKATYRAWQLDHSDEKEYAAKFGRLIPKPRKEDIKVEGLAVPHVGATNTFKICADILDQLGNFDTETIRNFLAVKILFKPANGEPGATVSRTVSREGSVWTVCYILRQQGTVTISASLCGVELEKQPFVRRTNPSEIKVGDRVERGPDWKWEGQDGGVGSKGKVVGVKKNGWVYVKWDNNVKHDYRWGAQESYDLKVVADD